MFSFGKKNHHHKPKIQKTLPALILNQEWHNLFSQKKPSKIAATEKKLESLLKKYAQVKQDLTEYETLKQQLMDGILADMHQISDDTDKKVDRKMETNSNLIKDLNIRMEKAEDELLDLPYLIDECNKELLFETAEHFYEKLIQNTSEYEKRVDEIHQLKTKLKKELERKVELEESNSFIYHKLHQIMGSEIIDQMDEYFIGKGKKYYDLKGEADQMESALLSEDKSI